MNEFVFAILALFIVVILYLYRRSYKENRRLGALVDDTISKKQSLSTKYGKMTEQFMPFLDVYPYNQQNFRFLGSPIDGVQFEDDKVIFIEFKTGDSRLSVKQNRIKDLVNQGKIEFRTFTIKN
ncbi:MAG: Holliday junction resolvase-like protein [Nanoarchaeota archaeon]